MGKLISNGINYSGLMNAQGVFIDTENVIVEATPIPSNNFSYTATVDCFIYFLANVAGGSGSEIYIDGKVVGGYWSGSQVSGVDYLYPLKKGQTIEIHATLSNNYGNYTVYGIQAGTGASGLIDYSTEEQKTGHKWIDGKDIWQKTFVLPSDTVTTANTWSTISGVVLSGNEDVIVKTEVFLGADKTQKVGFGKNDGGVFKYFDTIQLSISQVTIQYTKS